MGSNPISSATAVGDALTRRKKAALRGGFLRLGGFGCGAGPGFLVSRGVTKMCAYAKIREDPVGLSQKMAPTQEFVTGERAEKSGRKIGGPVR